MGRRLRHGAALPRPRHKTALNTVRVCPQKIPIPVAFHPLYAHRHYSKTTRRIGRQIYEALGVSPEECTQCETCLEACPAGLKIPERLAEVVRTFAGP